MPFTYVHILQSESSPDSFFVGLTEDLNERLKRHNAGEMAHTAKLRPWTVKTVVAFSDREKATAFERYLKSPSGRAFAKKRL